MAETFDRKAHWEEVYRSKPPEEVSWHQDEPRCSLELIEAAGLPRNAALIDVGGGASMLVDHLLRQGYSDLTVLDISGESLLQARQRLGVAADRVHWLETDITRFVPSRTYALWHDRAAFHFLTEARDRACYIAALCRALMPGGQAVIAAFAPEGPQRCSGLNIVQYDGDTLARELGSGFRRVESRSETHLTPQGREQKFGFHRFVREG